MPDTPKTLVERAEPFMDGYIAGSEGRSAQVPHRYSANHCYWIAGWQAGDAERKAMIAEGVISHVQ